MNKIIFIDIDNTLGMLIKQYLTFYNNLFIGYFEYLETDVLDTYDEYDFPTYTKEAHNSSFKLEKDRMIQIFNTDKFWETMQVLPGATEVFKQLNSDYDCYLLTAPSFKSKKFFTERLTWVENNFPFFDYHKIIFCENKSLFRSNAILIDDYGKNLETWRGKTIKINYRYNNGVRSDRNVNPLEWEKVPQLIRELSE
jgi:5'(3')-deoxyribonucleotidase